jgi:hypothetical protein
MLAVIPFWDAFARQRRGVRWILSQIAQRLLPSHLHTLLNGLLSLPSLAARHLESCFLSMWQCHLASSQYLASTERISCRLGTGRNHRVLDSNEACITNPQALMYRFMYVLRALSSLFFFGLLIWNQTVPEHEVRMSAP